MGGWGRRGEGEASGVAKETGGLVLCGFRLAFLRWEVGSGNRIILEIFAQGTPKYSVLYLLSLCLVFVCVRSAPQPLF
jgi:hypothetical protein